MATVDIIICSKRDGNVTPEAASRCKISKEGRRDRVRDRVHHRLAAAARATWAAAAAVVAATAAEDEAMETGLASAAEAAAAEQKAVRGR